VGSCRRGLGILAKFMQIHWTVDSNATLRGVPYHDGALERVFIYKIEEQRCLEMVIVATSRRCFVFKLYNVILADVRNFLFGNIISTIYVFDKSELPRKLVSLDLNCQELDHDLVIQGGFHAFRLDSSYGASISAIFERMTIEESCGSKNENM
jgi:hypothetical protein